MMSQVPQESSMVHDGVKECGLCMGFLGQLENGSPDRNTPGVLLG
jgi:hypothetical protein